MSNKTLQLVLLMLAFLLLYVSSTVLTGIPGIVCMLTALALTLISAVMMIRNFRK